MNVKYVARQQPVLQTAMKCHSVFNLPVYSCFKVSICDSAVSMAVT